MSESNRTRWLNICVDCGHQVTTFGINQVGQCPECAKKSKSLGWRWLCHLVNAPKPHNSLKTNGGTEKTPTQKLLNPTETRNKPTRELCHPIKQGLTPKMKALQGSPMARGRPKLDISPGEIKKLSQKGYGAKSIARQLSEKYGVPVSYQTVLRRLSNNGNGKHKS